MRSAGECHGRHSNAARFLLYFTVATRGAFHSSYDVSVCTKPTIGMMNGLADGGGGVHRAQGTAIAGGVNGWARIIALKESPVSVAAPPPWF